MIRAHKKSGWSESTTWQSSAPDAKRYPALGENLHVDALIVGGGLTGVTAAYLLAKQGLRVALVERDRLGAGATSLTTAFITSSLDTDYAGLERAFGPSKAAAILSSHEIAIDLIEQIVADEAIDCDFMRVSNYIYAAAQSDEAYLEEEREAADRMGMKLSRFAPGKMGFVHHGYLELKDQAKFHPLKYLSALAYAAQEKGTMLFEKSEVVGLSGKGPVKATVRTHGGERTIEADHVLLATYGPYAEPLSLYFKKAYYDSYVYELRLPQGAVPEGLYEDTRNPYHYFRIDSVTKEEDRMIVGGEDHRSDIPLDAEKGFAALGRYVDETFVDLPLSLVARWRGPILEPVDGLAFIGAIGNAPVHYAFGFSGNGMTYASIAAHCFAYRVAGVRPHADISMWPDLYDAGRLPGLASLAVKGRDYVEEFFGGAAKNFFKYEAE